MVKKHFSKIFIVFATCLMLVAGIFIFTDRIKTVNADNNPISPYNIVYLSNWTSHSTSFNFRGSRCWTDGTNIYYSSGSSQYVLDTSTLTWSAKTWTGLTSFNGELVWTDGINYYYSESTFQYVLDISTSTWSAKTWTGLTLFSGSFIWTDGTNYYYSVDTTQYVLDISTSTWSAKTWTGLTNFDGSSVWTDGTNIYYSNGSSQYVLDISTSTWSVKTWNGLTSFNGSYIWSDGINYYFSNGSSQYVLDISTSIWSEKTWTGYSTPYGNQVFSSPDIVIFVTDGTGGSSTWYTLDSQQSSGGGGNETNTYYHFTGSSYNLLAFADSSSYIFGNHYVDIEDISSSQFTVTFNADTVITAMGSNALSYISSSNLSFSSTLNLNYDYSSNQNVAPINNFPYFLACYTSNWSNSDIVGCIISTTLDIVDTQFNFGHWIDGYGVVYYHFAYFNSSNETLHILVAGTYDTTIIDPMPFVLSNRTIYFTNIGGTGSFADGYNSGYEDGQQLGYSNGFNAGSSAGYNTGYNAGLSAGDGAGYSRGYSVGYNAGIESANNYSFFGLISAVVDAPFTYFSSMLNFDLLGFNILNFVTALLTLALVVVVVKKLMGR